MLDKLLPDILIRDEDASRETTSWFLELAARDDKTADPIEEDSSMEQAMP